VPRAATTADPTSSHDLAAAAHERFLLRDALLLAGEHAIFTPPAGLNTPQVEGPTIELTGGVRNRLER